MGLKVTDRSPKPPSKALPVTLLSGFLGSGKTTLLQHVLNSDHGYKTAVIVNDIGAVNVDASLIKHTVSQTKETVVALQNGCICCTLRGDLLQELVRLSELAEFDYVIIESSGISEPGQVAETFDSRLADQLLEQGSVLDGLDKATVDALERLKASGGVDNFARLDTTCTVVDAFTILSDFDTADLLSARRDAAVPEDERTISDVMVDQIEFADVVIINKIGMVSESLRKSVRSLVGKLTHRAKVLESDFGKVDVKEIIDTGRFNMDQAQTGYGWLQDLHATTLQKNFVYVRRRPFHPRRLYELICDKFVQKHEVIPDLDIVDGDLEDGDGEDEEMDDDDEDGAALDGDDDMTDAPELPDHATILANKKQSALFARLFRSKGEIWLASRPQRTGEWSQAGAMLTMVGGRPWFAATPETEWKTGDREIDALVQVDMQEGGVCGDRRQEVVFIGERLDIEGLETVLDRCLLTDAEWSSWLSVMEAGHGVNDVEPERLAAKVAKLNDLFEDGFPDWSEDSEHEHDHDHSDDGKHSHQH